MGDVNGRNSVAWGSTELVADNWTPPTPPHEIADDSDASRAWYAEQKALHLNDEQPDLLVGMRNGAWLDQQTFPPLRYAVPGVVPEGFSLLVGPPKAGKSWLVLAFGLAIASGGRALGSIDVGPPRPVLYLALEDGDRRLQERCRQLLERDPIPERLHYMTRIMPGKVLQTLEAWLAHHGHDSPLLVLDTLGRTMPPALQGETTYSRDYRIGAALKRLVDDHPGASLLVNHHDRKASSDDFVDAVSGTNGLAGSADTIIVLARPRNQRDGQLKITGRDVPEGEYAVSFNDAAWQLDGRDLAEAAQRAREQKVTAGLGDRSADVAAYVMSNPKGVRAAEVALALGIDQATARVYLARLYDADRIERAGRGLYGPPIPPVTSVTSVTSEDVEPLERNTNNTRNTPSRGADEIPEDPALDEARRRHEDAEDASPQELAPTASSGGELAPSIEQLALGDTATHPPEGDPA
ncbi:AAA family ATPase [Tenggerimyces flavus]|uniref:AAA family ATPase n=1 Tax=Tenggerimyces flavus TaxID=1708749 RepID=A0ABV7YM30_9ACTN|nr:AAA family ATPase [Tenggerimyces flavus]MBM7787779.1 DNA-binding CsgD family transcriptional regulator [Tenggerimyces flavus]